jgi:hypothetical protein
MLCAEAITISEICERHWPRFRIAPICKSDSGLRRLRGRLAIGGARKKLPISLEKAESSAAGPQKRLLAEFSVLKALGRILGKRRELWS